MFSFFAELLGDIQPPLLPEKCAFRIDFLQRQAQICVIAFQCYGGDLIQMLASIDIPVDDMNRVRGRRFSGNEIAGENAVEIGGRIPQPAGIGERKSWYQSTILLISGASAASSVS